MRKNKLQILLYFIILLCSLNLFALDTATNTDTEKLIVQSDTSNNKSVNFDESVNSKTIKVKNIEKFNKIDVSKLKPELDFESLKPETLDLDFKQIHFDFPNTQFVEFVRFITNLKQKILIGEELLKGNINISTQKSPITIKELMTLFKAVLNTRGLEYIETEFYIQVMKRSDSITKVYKLKYLKASDLAKSFSEMFRMSFRVGNTPQNIQITALDDVNSLLVLAPEVEQIEIQKSIKTLDIPVRQVLLEVMLIEITRGDKFDFGTNGKYIDKNFNIDMSNAAVKTETVAYSFTSGNWSIGIKANDSKSSMRVLSQPSVLATDNQKAIIKIGKKQPYVNGISSTSTGGGVQSNTNSSTTATADVGIDIEITPTININKDVTLELKLTLSAIIKEVPLDMGWDDAKNAPLSQNIPEVGHRNVISTAVIQDGKVLVIGGLIKNQKTYNKTSIPIVGEIPYIGSLFATTSEEVEQIELMIFIAPKVIEHSDQIKAYSDHAIKKLVDYDHTESKKLKTMIKGEKVKTDDTFKFYDYFNDSNYRNDQSIIQQPID